MVGRCVQGPIDRDTQRPAWWYGFVALVTLIVQLESEIRVKGTKKTRKKREKNAKEREAYFFLSIAFIKALYSRFSLATRRDTGGSDSGWGLGVGDMVVDGGG